MSKKPASKPAKRTLSNQSPLILTVVCAFLLGLEGSINLWGWTVLSLMVAIALYLVRDAIQRRAGFIVGVVAWAAVVPAAASLAFDTGKWTHYGLALLAAVVAIYFVKRAVNFGSDGK